MGRRNDHSREQQYEMAIAAAERLLIQAGIGGFSMRKVAQAIGYTVGQLYLLFKNQDDLFLALNERTAEAIFDALQNTIASASTPEQTLRAMARAYIVFALQHPARWRLLFEHRMPAGQSVPDAHINRVRRIFDLVELQLARVMPTANPACLQLEVTALWSSVHGIAVLAQSRKLAWSGIEDYGRLTDRLVAAFFSSFSDDSGAAIPA